jgi:hypothetical protein
MGIAVTAFGLGILLGTLLKSGVGTVLLGLGCLVVGGLLQKCCGRY